MSSWRDRTKQTTAHTEIAIGDSLDTLRAKALSILNTVFGYDAFRGGQESVILSLLSGRDTLGVMPTGQGKSICYQLPALILPGITLVISPLIALMKDQVDTLRARGIPAAALNSQTSVGATQKIFLSLRQNALKLLFIAPERLQNVQFVQAMQGVPISLVAVDEAHCISEWGYDFRPSYQKIASGLASLHLPKRPIMLALTATATEEVLEDIKTYLELQDPHLYIGGFERPNLSLSVFELENKRGKLLEILQAVPGAAMVYTMSRQLCETTAHFLNQNGISATYYHAGLSDEARTRIQEAYFQNRWRVICATSAFGMGINKPDVRVVVHLEPPETLEAYYQEAGRAGRDGKKAYAVLLFSRSDLERRRYLLEQSFFSRDDVEILFKELRAQGIELELRRDEFLEMLHSKYGTRFSNAKLSAICDFLERHHLIAQHSHHSRSEWLRLHLDRADFDARFRTAQGTERKILEQILRSFGSACFGQGVSFSLESFAEKAGVALEEALAHFQHWQKLHLCDFQSDELLSLTILAPHLLPKKLPLDWELLKRRHQAALNRFRAIERYLHYALCRRNFILDYFGEARYTEKCGICDNCLGRHQRNASALS
ncbi:MAG: RecQ family ATP-dependent DNA helicase [Chloroherpetonaceae bacterium]|nr:RecQ family ATP-dependent DNA helicase [Chloroherpetonaceae bacterium]